MLTPLYIVYTNSLHTRTAWPFTTTLKNGLCESEKKREKNCNVDEFKTIAWQRLKYSMLRLEMKIEHRMWECVGCGAFAIAN